MCACVDLGPYRLRILIAPPPLLGSHLKALNETNPMVPISSHPHISHTHTPSHNTLSHNTPSRTTFSGVLHSSWLLAQEALLGGVRGRSVCHYWSNLNGHHSLYPRLLVCIWIFMALFYCFEAHAYRLILFNCVRCIATDVKLIIEMPTYNYK